jgi:lysyl-tRNA synthetase class 2
MMHHIPGGATARPFMTHHNALDLDLYLRVAPELHLKRLLVGGLEQVYEINRNFRNEGVSTRHNPEFTMLEFYWAHADYHDLIELTEAMLRSVVETLPGIEDNKVSYQGEVLDFSGRFHQTSVSDAVLSHYSELSADDLRNRDRLADLCRDLGLHVEDSWGWGRLLMELFEARVEDTLIQPTFVTGYPIEVSPLSRRNDEDPELADRFEMFIAGREIANGFSELNDPEDQAERFRAQVAARDSGDAEAMHFDHDYIRALEYGMPPAAGEGVGIDRLVMLLTDSPSIRDVLLFPYLRPEAATGTS